MWETLSESSHGHCLVGFVFKCTTHGIRCSSAGGYQTALHYCGRPLLDWGELPVFVVRPRAPNRDALTVTVRYEYMYRATPSALWLEWKFSHLPIVLEKIWVHCYAYRFSCLSLIFVSLFNTFPPPRILSEFHPGRCRWTINQFFRTVPQSRESGHFRSEHLSPNATQTKVSCASEFPFIW